MFDKEKEKLQKQLEDVQERIKAAAISVGRDPSSIELVVVTKGKPALIIKTLFELGINTFGESYLKEALFKMELLKQYDINWHMIGTIQKGKVKSITDKFSQIQSIDRYELAEEISKRAALINKRMPVFLEVNLSGEPTKHGWKITSDDDLELFLNDAARILDFGSIRLKGLMTMAPYSKDPEDSRKYFKELKRIKVALVNKCRNVDELGLSMGMSGDFEVAIQEGTTMLRIGSAIVGDR